MSTFKVRIEDYVGSVGDDTFLGDALTDSAAEVIRAFFYYIGISFRD